MPRRCNLHRPPGAGKTPCKGADFSLLLTAMEAVNQAIEPEFLSRALATGVKLRIGQMNRSEQVGVVREIGRYEINVEDQGGIVTILKQDISYLSSPSPLITPPAASEPAPPPSGTKPNIQQE